MINLFLQAVTGHQLWKQLALSGLVLLFPDACQEISLYGLLYADEYADSAHYDNITMIFSDTALISCARKLVRHRKRMIVLSVPEMDLLLRYLSLCIDTMGNCIIPNIVYISLLYPNGSSVRMLYEKKIFPASYLVWNRIYHRSNAYYAEPPKTNDIILKKIMKRRNCNEN